MATFPVSADKLRRRLPQEGMQVVDVPDGSVVGRAVQRFGSAIEGVGSTLNRNAEIDRRKAENDQDYEFAANYDRFQSEQKTKAVEAQRNMQPGGSGLTSSLTTAYQKDADTFLQTLPERLKPRFKKALAGFGLDLTDRARGAEDAERNRFAVTNTLEDEKRHIGEATASDDPKVIADAKAKTAAFIKGNPNLTPIQKDELTRGLDDRYAKAYADRLQADPQRARAVAGQPSGQVGGIDIYEKPPGGGATGNGPPGSGGRARSLGAFDRGSAIKAHYQSGGASDIAAAALGGHAIVENGGRATGKPGDNGTAFGTYQWRGKRLTNLKAFAAERGSDWTDQKTQLDFAKAEGEPGGKYTDEGAVRAWRELASATSVEQAVKAWMHFERPQGYSANAPENGHSYATRLSHAKRLLGQSGDVGGLETGGNGGSSPRPDFNSARNHFASLFPNASPDTLNTLAERTVRGAESYDREQAQVETARMAGLYNQLQTDILDGKAGLADIQAARDQGWLTDADKIKSAMGWVEQRDKEATADADAMDILRAGGRLNPFDEKQAKVADRMFAGLTNGAAGDLGAAERAIVTIQQATGIVPKAGASALRGAIAVGSAEQQAQAYQITAGVLAKNPNAFGGVEGGADLAKRGMQFSHYAELGMASDQAARRVTEMNSPDYQSKIKVGEKELKAFQKTISDDTVSGAFDDRSWLSYFTGDLRAETGVNAEQKRAMLSDFTELASDYYRETGDANLAKDMAKRTLSNVYGVTKVGGAPILTKYPIEKAYPALPDKEGEPSHGYINEQARAAIKEAAGVDVKPEDVVISYIPNVTARNFGTGRAPIYGLGYMREVNGQRVYDVIPNAGFKVDFEAAKKASDAGKAERDAKVQEGFDRNLSTRDELTRRGLSPNLMLRRTIGPNANAAEAVINQTQPQDVTPLEQIDVDGSDGPVAPVQPEGYQDAPNLF